GSVIHAMHHEQDMRNMGGIRKIVPVTYVLMWIGSLALAGIPPFAGYYSKDLILEVAYAAHTPSGHFAFLLGTVAAFLTAFYSFRLVFMTFHGESRADHHTMEHAHESPKVMILPLLLLAAGAIVSGFAGSHLLGMVHPDGGFWKDALFVLPEHDVLKKAHHVPEWVKWLPVGLAVLGIAMAYVFYVIRPGIPKRMAAELRNIYKFLLNKWYFDELYGALFVQNAKRLGTFLWKVGDVRIIDGLGPNGAAWLALRGAIATARTQSGFLYHYAFAMMLGLLLLVSWLTYILLGGGQ
ncbi:MAG: proton-conducting transporter membrane subunit, partial [Rickettsiales bacterium]